jgi:S-layer homology domain
MTRQTVSLRVFAGIVVLACAGIVSGEGKRLITADGPRVPAGPPINFGTTQENFVTIGAWDFDPSDSDQTYDFPTVLDFRRFSTGGGATGFLAGVHLPDGAVLTSITFDLCDSSIVNAHWTAALASCSSLEGLCLIVGEPITSASNIVTPCAAYTQDLSGLNYQVDNQALRLALVTVPDADDITNAFAGATLGYKLQVSPAPGAPTFVDVPTDHPFFQFIEALAKSGITGGCGGGNYCPDNPVTRGQMAVFLAKGLGLQFP